jgi:hypothetical protein
METYQEYKQKKSEIDATLQKLETILKSFPKTDWGLVPDEVRKSELYIKTKNDWNLNFSLLRSIHTIGMKKFKKEIQKEIKDRIAAANKKYMLDKLTLHN